MYVSLLHNSFLGVQQTIRKLLAAKMLQISLESFLIKVNLVQKLASRIRIYLLTLFLSFLFLRQMEKVLPNAKTLQNLIQNGESCIIDGWQCGYVTDLAKWGKSIKSGSNTKTPLGLFDFFSTPLFLNPDC